MIDGGKIGVKAVSTVIAAVIVLTIFLGLASAIYAGIFQLGNESGNLVKREAERAMEAFFQIYWLNETHVVLFNNHSSVPVTLLYWVSVNASTGAYTVTPLNPAIYTVPPGTMRIVQNFNNRASLYSLYSIHRVVSEKGSTFEVTDAPTELHTLIYFTPTEKIVRPGFNGRLTTFVIPTGPDFGGGDVTVTCVNIINISTQATIPCTTWGITFVPSSTITISAGGVGTIGVEASIIPSTFPLGFYAVKLRLQTASFTREYMVRVIVSDFSASITPVTLTLNRAGCALPVTLTITTSLSYTGHINIKAPPPVPQLVIWSSPNPIHPPADSISLIIVERRWTGPLVFSTDVVNVILSDGLGVAKTVVFTVVHRGVTAIATPC
jgi:hypothetical protein